MPTTIDTYYPVLPEQSEYSMVLESEGGSRQLRFRRRNGADMPIAVRIGRQRGTVNGSAARAGFYWETASTAVIRPNMIVVTGGRTGLFIRAINRDNVEVNSINFSAVEARYCPPEQIRNNPTILVSLWQRPLGMPEFLREVDHHRREAGLQLVSRMAVVVAVGTGVAMAVGFGPAAGLVGAGSGLGASGNAFVAAVANGITTFMQQSFTEMTRLVQNRNPADAHRVATRFWENNEARIRDIVGLSLNSAAFNYATSFIPGPSINSSSDFTMRTLLGMIMSRMANNLIGAFQSIYEDWARGRNIDWNAIETGLIRGIVVRGLA